MKNVGIHTVKVCQMNLAFFVKGGVKKIILKKLNKTVLQHNG